MTNERKFKKSVFYVSDIPKLSATLETDVEKTNRDEELRQADKLEEFYSNRKLIADLESMLD